jgi:hypothetical protein
MSDGKRVESKIRIGLVRNFPDRTCAWAEVDRQHLHINRVDFRGCITFADLAKHYAEHELSEPTESIHPKAHTTIKGYERILRNRLLPRWGNRVALSIEPLEVEAWLKTLKGKKELANPTLDKTRRVMSLVYRHGQRYGLIPRNQESNPMRFVRCKTTSGNGCQGILLRGEVLFIEVDAKALNPLKTTSIHNAARMVESCATNPIRGGPARKPT